MPPSPSADSEVGLVTEALIDSNDQLLAMYDLAELTSQSLDEDLAVAEILQRAGRVVRADALFFVVDGRGVGTETPTVTADDAVFEVTNAADVSGSLVARRADRFGTAERKLLQAIANLCLGASHAARLHAKGVADAVVQRDYDTAAAMAVMALPHWRPDVPGASCYARSDPARAAGGDLFAFGVSGQRIDFAVGDVAGKGLPAAMMMTTIISAATAAFQLSGERGPAAVLSSIDDWVFHQLSEASVFVTLVVGSLDVSRRELMIVNAGHSPVLLARDGVATDIGADMPPLGVFPLADVAPTLTARRHELELFDRLVVASDGFTEQFDADGAAFGDDAVTAIVTAPGSLDRIGGLLYDEVEAFAAGADQSDDRTLFMLGLDDRRGAKHG